MTIAGTITPKPETVREAVIAALADFARAYNKPADAAAVDLYVRVLERFSPEAIARGARSVLEEERYFPAPSTFRTHVLAEHERLARAQQSVVLVRQDDDGRRCPICGAIAYLSEKGRLVIDHEPHAHGVHRTATVM